MTLPRRDLPPPPKPRFRPLTCPYCGPKIHRDTWDDMQRHIDTEHTISQRRMWVAKNPNPKEQP